ncbi:type II and III secretion system protein family protein [Qipengyuania oceanensis]|uniref:Type II and III secretion system protein family protein n=1 Tax=Qipengyuania oceanensis TaxID=1463597 RepID=A0A844YCK9_9SPHN|nr:type II and III secretion system protein family protein [Qipengyuania oceanensis]MXO62260.1 type II and III secretion system protein family protein [Qipengyuania oceanensis]
MVAAKSMRAAALLLATIAPVAWAAPAAAQYVDGSSLHAGTLEVPLNKSQIVSTDRPIARAMIGNADIADILPVTDRSIYVLGKSFGTTSLTLYDASGRVLTIMDVAVGPDTDGFRDQVARVIPDQQIDAHISGGSMVLTGLVSDAGAIDRAVQLARTFAGDNLVNLISLGSSQQVMLEVKFAEINKSAGKELGFRLLGDNGRNFGFGSGQGAEIVGGAIDADAISNSFGVASRTGIGLLGLTIDAYVEALEAKGFAKTLANPTLVAMSGETASFLAGGEFPIPVAQNGNNDAISVQFKPFGVSLGFTPTVLGDKTINLVVEPEVSSIDSNASIALGGLNIPGVQTRRASTTIELRDGESFAIAGLIQQDMTTQVSQVPLLGSLPIIGALFRSTSFQKGETELIIVVTPRLVAPLKPQQVRLPTDSVKEANELDIFLMGNTHEMKDGASAAAAPAQPATGGDYEY